MAYRHPDRPIDAILVNRATAPTSVMFLFAVTLVMTMNPAKSLECGVAVTLRPLNSTLPSLGVEAELELLVAGVATAGTNLNMTALPACARAEIKEAVETFGVVMFRGLGERLSMAQHGD